MKLLRKWLILAHRYLGVALGLVVMMWFATGIVMMYAGGMPRLTPELRLQRLAALDPARVRLTPAEAAERAGLKGFGGRAVLVSILDRPAYRFGQRRPTIVFADTGERLDRLGVAQARAVASRFAGLPEDRIRYLSTLDRVDQWTLIDSAQLPLYKFAVEDAGGTELYVSERTGEVAMMTTRRSRALAWAGTIPHWFYFSALRTNQPLWYRVVVWTSALACILAVIGLALALTRSWKSYVGLLRWHYVTGALFGVFTLTFAFSGLLSMEPFAWTNAQGLEIPRQALTGGEVDLSAFGPMDPVVWNRLLDGRSLKEVEFVRIQGEHYYAVRHTPATEGAGRRERLHQPYYVTGRREPERLLVSAGTLQVRDEPFSTPSILARLREAVPDAPILESALLTEYDSYYYSRQRLTPLPVLRVKFGDAAETWVYIDPSNSQVLSAIPRLARLERWLYNGLHSLDFAFWYDRRPLWDIVMIVLSLGGLATSGLGVWMGLRRLRRAARRAAPAFGTGEATKPVLHTERTLSTRMP